MPTQKMTNEIIIAAIDGFELQKQRINAQLAELRQMLSGSPTEAIGASEPKKGRRKMSAAARKRISEAMRKRWAAKSAAQPGRSAVSTPEVPKRKKRKLSAAGRKRIIDATKKRWALVRAQAAKKT